MSEETKTMDRAVKAMHEREGKSLTFTLAEEEYGTGIPKIKEIIGMMPITTVPQAPEFVEGVINLRGKLIPVMDLKLRFGMGDINKSELRTKPMMTKIDVLVVEKDSSVGSHIKKSITDWGHNVELLTNGKEVLEKVSQNRFDLMFVDIFLHDQKGHRLIPKIKELRPDINIVATTDYNSRDLEAEVRREKIVFYMIKPFNLDEVKEILWHISKMKRKEVKKKWLN